MKKTVATDFRKKFEDQKKVIATAKKELTKIASVYFKEAFGEFFEKYPGLKSVSWEAATYEWDDNGDYYKSFHTEPTINGMSHYGWEELDEDGWDEEEREEENPDFPDRVEAIKEVTAFLSQFGDKDIILLFGEDVNVEITKQGVSVTDF